MIKLGNQDFDSLISTGVVLVDFYADWCGPCKMMGVVLEEIDSLVSIIKVNVDEHGDLARSFGVMSIPTILLYKDGKLIKKNVGFVDKDTILSWINES